MQNFVLNAKNRKKNPNQNSPMQKMYAVGLLLFIASTIVAIDQFLKWNMLEMLVYGNTVPVVKNYFSLTLVFNTGAAFGILQGKKYLFLVLPFLTVIFIFVLFIKSKNKNNLVIPLSLLLGGTIGNLIDRLKYGYVVDFFDFFFRRWHWPAFNIADMCICFGMVLIFLQMIRKNKN